MTETADIPSAIGVAIKRMEANFTAAERRIARVLATGFPTAGMVTVAELGRQAGASGATISRFVAKLGFPSYQDFQDSLRQDLRERLESPLIRFSPASVVDGDVHSYAEWAASLMSEAGNMIATAEFDAVLNLLEDRKRSVYLIGGRFSRSLAELFAFGLHGLRGDVHLVDGDRQSLIDTGLELGKRDIVIVFDFRRYQDDIVRFSRIAAEAGATLIVFTDRWMSPACSDAHFVFALPVASPSIYDSALAPLMCVEAMVAALARKLGPDAEARIARAQGIYDRLA